MRLRSTQPMSVIRCRWGSSRRRWRGGHFSVFGGRRRVECGKGISQRLIELAEFTQAGCGFVALPGRFLAIQFVGLPVDGFFKAFELPKSREMTVEHAAIIFHPVFEVPHVVQERQIVALPGDEVL